MLAVSLSLAVILTLRPETASNWFPVLLGGLLMYGLGLADDLRPLGAKVKLAGQILTACLVYWMGLSIDRVTYPGGAWSVQLGAWNLPVTVLWLIAVPNIINLIDGFDGLASGLGISSLRPSASWPCTTASWRWPGTPSASPGRCSAS